MRDDTSWIQTYTGKQFWPLDPRPEDLDIVDIAHALSNICRFTGHCRTFYSVAEHSCHVSIILPPELKLWGLLHDASEAYLCDIASPVKHQMPHYQRFERRLMLTVAERFNLLAEYSNYPELPTLVHEADMTLCATEVRDLMGAPPVPWRPLPPPLPEVIVPMSPGRAELWFLRLWEELRGEQ